MLPIALLWDIDCCSKQVRRIGAYASIDPEAQTYEAYLCSLREEACFGSFSRTRILEPLSHAISGFDWIS
jgi:hypothetical protein